jgi:hypothetical protein
MRKRVLSILIIDDAVEILRQLSGLLSRAPDGSTIDDVLEILKFLAGLPSKYD